MPNWNLWHGCHRVSEGCLNCYVYRMDSSYGRKDSFIVRKTSDFALPLKKDRQGNYRLRPEDGVVFTCMTSDFFVEDADCWREQAWDMMRIRSDLSFCIVTKRIEQAEERLPADWGEGYENVAVACTVENQRTADIRLPVFKAFPAKHKLIFCSPLLEGIDLSGRLEGIEEVCVGGESGEAARPCCWEWVKEIYGACKGSKTRFTFHQTGALFLKDGREYRIPRKMQHEQAKKGQALLTADDYN